jgi:hypothetical protein
MKQQAPSLARAAALLLAAAALPLTPVLAQETSPPAETPATETPPPDATTSIPPPEATTPAPETPVTTAEPAAPAPVARTTTRRTETRTTRRVPATVPGPAIPVAVAPAPIPVETLPPVATTPLPPPVAQTPPLEVLPETPPAPVTTTVETKDSRDSLLPWLLGGLLLIGALAFFALRGRRRTAVRDEVFEPAPVAVAPVAAAAPIVAPVETAVPAGRPELNLTMRPRRAGVSGDDARVEFELTVGNTGPVAAENVRISTWMLAAGSSEAESALIVPRDHADTPPVTIGAGESRTMEASVALPTAEVDGDAVLPVVVADARYSLPGGGEGRTSASFAVGVPDGEELAHFGIDNPSGLHEGVVARPLGEPERV